MLFYALSLTGSVLNAAVFIDIYTGDALLTLSHFSGENRRLCLDLCRRVCL